MPLLDVDDAVAEIKRASRIGFHVGFLPPRPPFDQPPWQDEHWDPIWDAFGETGMVIGFHIGTEPHKPDARTGVYRHGRGGGVLNYVETTYGGQRCVTQVVACGALDRHPEMKVLVSEGGATWGPFIADRMDEGYRQHGAAVRPKLSKQPSQSLYEQVYASFQHDRSAVAAATAMGGGTYCGGATTRTTRAPTFTPRRRSTSCLTTSDTKPAVGSPSGPLRSCSRTCLPRPRPSRGAGR